jgi:mannose-6-phosphate isomerase-like protein (cupin superfamily)
MIQALLKDIAPHVDAIMSGDFSALEAPPFAGFATHTSPNGSTVIAVDLPEATRASLPPTHQCVDLFLLDAHCQLGRHYHRRASAHIHIIRGDAIAHIDGVDTRVSPGDETLFPAGSVHDVRSFSSPVLFASFQDNPILQPDGSVDYVAVS